MWGGRTPLLAIHQSNRSNLFPDLHGGGQLP